MACRAAWAINSQNMPPLVLAVELIGKNELWEGNDDLLHALWMVQPNHPAAGSLLVLSLVKDGRVAEAEHILSTLKGGLVAWSDARQGTGRCCCCETTLSRITMDPSPRTSELSRLHGGAVGYQPGPSYSTVR